MKRKQKKLNDDYTKQKRKKKENKTCPPFQEK